jgi:hypothetical protein
MPKIKRYFPVSHQFNRDPEVRELRQKYADWMGYVWQEMCSISDMNEGEVPGKAEEIAKSLAYISLKKYLKPAEKTIQKAFEFMSNRGWICIESSSNPGQIDRILVLKYAKYHRTPERDPVPPNLPNLPNLPKEKKHSLPQSGEESEISSFRDQIEDDRKMLQRSIRRVEASAGELQEVAAEMQGGFDRIWAIYPRKEKRAKAERIFRKARIDPELMAQIIEAIEKQSKTDKWRSDGGRWVPLLENYLRDRRWEDQIRDKRAEDDAEYDRLIAEKRAQFEREKANGRQRRSGEPGSLARGNSRS